MKTTELNAYAITALLNLANEMLEINADKTYTLNADFKFVVINGKAEALDVLSLRLTEKPDYE
jgi:hypothetical protein